jgi:glucose-6-phosphate 1-dehydrogenase
MRSDQVEEAWDVVTTIQEAWENDKSLSLDKYEAGRVLKHPTITSPPGTCVDIKHG